MLMFPIFYKSGGNVFRKQGSTRVDRTLRLNETRPSSILKKYIHAPNQIILPLQDFIILVLTVCLGPRPRQ